ncbi:hypothetical protein M9Y10_016117 [Tritrichomonas musculus]|uniref:E3 ubiquitin-protein ligase n=1 Tax=Tritrichomonas musculus TaxID=1915356 RepID=A0ABR2I6J5_9EUKA
MFKKLFSKTDNNKKLSSLFSSSPEKGILQAQQYLMSPNYSNYEEFIQNVKKTQKSNCCIVSWSKSMLSARCLDCQKHDNSCICIPCYLAGKHDQHHSYLLGGSGAGNCDCGDPHFWKPSGNCPNHPGPDPNPDITQMTTQDRDKFITVFKSAFTASFSTKDDDKICVILDWISDFISFGDGLRRCVAISITSIPAKVFFNNLMHMQKNSLNSLISLLGKLTSDQVFSQQMGSTTLKNYLSLRNIIRSIISKHSYDKNDPPLHPIKKYLSFSFHFFTEVPLMHLVNEFNFDWVEFILSCLSFIFDTMIQLKMNYERIDDGSIIDQIWYLSRLLEFLIKDDKQHENIQKFIDKYSQLLVNYERLYTFNFPRVPEDDSNDPYTSFFLYIYLYQINVLFSPLKDRSPKNQTFSIQQTFKSLLAFYQNKKKFQALSLFNKKPVPISAFLPLHHLFYCILSSHPNSLKVISNECKSNKISVQDFCYLVTICPMRILAATFVTERFKMLNNATRRHITYFLDKPDETFNIFFGLVQTMLGIAPDKEKMLDVISTTFGIKDEVPSMEKLPHLDRKKYLMQLMDHQNQLEMKESAIFDFSIFVTAMLTDRSIITFDKILFKRLRVIGLLMNKKPNSREIEKFVDDKISNPIFGDDLQSYAARVSTSNGSFFKLTNEDEFTPFFPVIYRTDRVEILMKYKDKLIPILDYTQLPRGLEMDSCFRKPTFLASMFSLLCSSKDTFTQIGLAMFILCIRNGEKFDLGSYEFANPLTVTTPSIIELIDILKEVLGDNPHFNFLTMRIQFGEEKKMTFIEAVQSKQRLGYDAMERTDLPPVLRPKTAVDDQIQKEKKEKAKNLRKQLMKEFQDQRAQFTIGGGTTCTNDDDDDDDNAENRLRSPMSSRREIRSEMSNSASILCSICQTRTSDDVLGFPCLSLPCLFPALINNKLHNLGIPINNLESVYSFSICMHHVHFKCFMGLHRDKKKKDIFNCMIDRGSRNCLLPLFPTNINKDGESDDFSIQPSETLDLAIKKFMINAFYGCSLKGNPIAPFKSFAGTVMTIEVRHRARPECLDNPTVSALLHNLLLTFYFSLHGCSIGEDIKDPLVKLVYLIINSSFPKVEFSSFVKQLSHSLKEDYLYEFLRRAAIIEDFAIKSNTNNKFIDWDEVLSFENLLKRYEIEYNNDTEIIELPIFETIPLAERFVGLYQPPYNLDIFNNSLSKFVDLMTGKVVVFAKDKSTIQGKTDLPYIQDYVLSQYQGGLAMFLGLTGPNASDIIVSCQVVGHLFNLDGFYVDQFGDIDRGFNRGALLSLSKDRLENSLDKLLSGDIILFS